MYTVKQEIDLQFEAVARTIEYISGRKKDIIELFSRTKKLLVLGSGSSYSLAKSLALQFTGLAEIPAWAVAAGDYVVNSQDYASMMKGATIVTISRSGNTSEIIYAVNYALDASAKEVVSLCAVKDAALAKISTDNYEMPWIFDTAVCQTRTVSNFYAAGLMIAALVGHHDKITSSLWEISNAAEEFTKKYDSLLQETAARDWTHAVVLADSYWAGLAEEGALAFKEICRLPSNHYNVLDVRHGPMVLLNEKTLVVAMTSVGDKHQEALLRDVREKGAQLLSLTYGGDGEEKNRIQLPLAENPCVSALFMIYTIQLLTYYKALARGVNPDEPEGLDPWIKLSE